MGASNYPVILTALSLPARAFTELPVFRNFYAHRNKDTAAQVAGLARSHLISPKLHPSEVLAARAGGPNNLVSQYSSELINIMQLMV
jgi:hypothetical protein